MRNLTPFTAAEETLGIASAQRGLGGMERTAAPKGPNMFDGGAASKVAVNSQPYNNARLQEQNILQNMTSALPQAQADAVHDVGSKNWLLITHDLRQNVLLNNVQLKLHLSWVHQLFNKCHK